MKSVMITGATSMLGIATMNACIKNGVKVYAIYRSDSRKKNRIPNHPMIERIELDLAEFESAELCVNDCDVFYHFGWGSTDRSGRDNPSPQIQNIKYTIDAVRLAHRCGCKKFIGAGSQAEYGFWNESINEEHRTEPTTCYGIAKLAAGKLAAKECNQLGMLCIWSRIFSVYGKNDGENTMVSYAVRQYINHEKADFSSGIQPWNFLYEEDAGMYFYLIGEKMQESGIINVANPSGKLLKDYIMDMAQALGEGFDYSLASANGMPANGITPDTGLLLAITDYAPVTSFEEGIKLIVEAKK